MNPLAPLAVVGSALGGALTLAVQNSTLPSFAAVLKGDKTSTDSPQAASEVEVDLQDRLQKVSGKLRQRLAGAGIDVSQPIAFSESPSGGIEVDSGHPQWRAIEEILNGSPELVGELNELLAAAAATSDDLAPDAKLILRTGEAALLADDQLVAAANDR